MCFPAITKVMPQEWEWCVPVSMLVEEIVLIAKDMGALLVCNLLQSQDASTQVDVSKNRVILDDSLSSALQVNRPVMRTAPVIPLMPQSSDLE